MTFDVLVVAVPLLIIGAAVSADIQSRSGYSLTALAVLVLIAAIVDTVVTIQVERHQATTHTDTLGSGIFEVAYLLVLGAFTLALWIGGLVEAASARQWRWLVGIFLAGIIPSLIAAFEPIFKVGELNVRLLAAMVAIYLAILVTLAYGIYRCVRPAQPVAPRRPAMPAR